MTESELRKAIFRGHGRTILLLRAQASQENLPLVLSECLRCNVFDGQEEDRGDYLWRLVQTLPKPEACVDPLIQRLFISRSDYLRNQIRSLLGQFRKAGNEAARQALVRDFHRWRLPDKHQERAAQYLGWPGMELVLEHADRIEDLWMPYCWATGELGEKLLRRWLERRAKTCAAAARMLERNDEIGRNYKEPQCPASAAEALDQIRQRKSVRRSDFMKLAKAEDWVAAAELALETEDRRTLHRLRSIFGAKNWPLGIDRVLEKARHDPDELRFVRLLLLRGTCTDEVRQWALQRIRSKDRIERYAAFSLLELNAKRRDWPALTRALWARRSNPCEFHHLAMSIRNLKVGTPSPALEAIYEYGPCGLCRSWVVRALSRRKLLTREQIEECLEDSYEDTRELAGKLLKQVTA